MAHIQRKGSSWQARFRAPDGTERARNFKTKAEAQAWAAVNEADIARGTWIDPNRAKVTVRQFIEDSFMPSLLGLRPTTRAQADSYIRSLILPTFGDWPLGAVSFADCQAWVAELSTRKAPATVGKAAQWWGRILDTAHLDRRIPVNPMTGVRRPTIERHEMRFLASQEVAALADAMAAVAPRFRAMVLLGCYAGPRIGEISALRHTDFDPLRRTITIERTAVEVGGHRSENATKTKAGRRSVVLPSFVADALVEHQAEFANSPHLFACRDGSPIRHNNFRRREWARATEAAELEGFRIHDMRHTAVALWIAAGATDLEIARRAGHTSVSFTKDRYGHLFPQADIDLAARMDNMYASATAPPPGQVLAIRR